MNSEKKKNILVLSHWLELGGVERSLIGLLESFDYSKYKVDLFLCRHTGELMKMIPNEVNLLPEIPQAASIAKPVRSLVCHIKYYGILSARVMARVFSKFYVLRNRNSQGNNIVEIDCVHKLAIPFISQINKNMTYDCAISFLAPHYLGVKKVNALKKVAWIHTDYNSMILNKKSEKKIWGMYDHIVSISEKCTESFCSVFSELSSKVIYIENILVPENIIAQADEEVKLNKNSEEIMLCTVGRFCYQKNFDNIPNICKIIVESGYSVKWYLIGFGTDEPLIKQKILEACMQEHVILLGKKDNPYPYIKMCDIYIQPSRCEGKAVTVREAQILEKPVVITAFPTAESQLSNGEDGIIVPIDNKGCANGIISLINNEDLRKKLSLNCRKRNYGNQKEINKLYEIME